MNEIRVGQIVRVGNGKDVPSMARGRIGVVASVIKTKQMCVVDLMMHPYCVPISEISVGPDERVH